MTESPFDADGVQWAWNASSIEIAEACLRKYQYAVIEGWRSRAESVHLRFGSIYAKAHEHYFKYVADGMDKDEALHKVVYEALVSTWEHETDVSPPEAPHPVPVPGTGKPWESFDNRKTRENLIRSIIWYFDHFKNDSVKVITLQSGKPAVELSFMLEISPHVVFTGHLDSLVDYEGVDYVMDQKTTGSTIGPAYWSRFNPNTQFSMYTFAGQAVFATPVKGVLIDAAQIAVGFTRFERNITMRTQAQLNEWLEDTLWHIKLAQDATHAKRFPMNPAACGLYGGCQFRAVCARSPEVRYQFLKADFEPNQMFNPLEQR